MQPVKEQWNIDKRETSWFFSKNEHVFEKCFEVMCLFSFQKLDTEPENGIAGWEYDSNCKHISEVKRFCNVTYEVEIFNVAPFFTIPSKFNDRRLLITGKSFFLLLFLKGIITTQVYNMTEKQLVA